MHAYIIPRSCQVADCGIERCRDLYATYSSDEYAVELAKVDTVHRSQGMCVECVEDCDCGVNEFCGFDFDDSYEKATQEWTYTYKVKIPSGISSTNMGGGMPANVKRDIELYAKQFEGLPIKSKCKKYSTSHIKGPKVCNANIEYSAFAQMVEQSLLSSASDQLSTCDFQGDQGSKTRVKRTPQYWPKAAQGVCLFVPTQCDYIIVQACNSTKTIAHTSFNLPLLLPDTRLACVCVQIDSVDGFYLGDPNSTRPHTSVKLGKQR